MKKTIKSLFNKLPYIKGLYQQAKNFNDNSCFPPGHFYSPIVSVADVKKRQEEIWKEVRNNTIKGLDLNEEGQLRLVQELSTYYKDIPFTAAKQDDLRYYFENDYYSYTDGIVLYSMIRHLRPRRIIEVGSGFSSAVMLDVNELFFKDQIQLTFIEPYPDRLFSIMSEKDKQNSNVIVKSIREVDMEKFNELEKGDILFIDSSHVVKCGSDVQFILFNILPNLKDGVIIHFHDIFYPFEYPKDWVFGGFNWNEDYFLRAFLMYNTKFEIKLFAHFIHYHHSKAFSDMPLSYKNGGANLWIEKMAR
jgi:predicted O-methyltransferase YrrM